MKSTWYSSFKLQKACEIWTQMPLSGAVLWCNRLTEYRSQACTFMLNSSAFSFYLVLAGLGLCCYPQAFH